MPSFADDDLVDSVTIVAAHPRAPTRVKVGATGDLLPIKHLLESVGWTHLDVCAQQCADAIGFGSDAGQALFAGNPDIDQDVPPFEGVLIANAVDDQVIVGVDAFYRLMDRFFSVMIDHANAQQHPVLQDPRWAPFLEHAARVRQRVP